MYILCYLQLIYNYKRYHVGSLTKRQVQIYYYKMHFLRVFVPFFPRVSYFLYYFMKMKAYTICAVEL